MGPWCSFSFLSCSNLDGFTFSWEESFGPLARTISRNKGQGDGVEEIRACAGGGARQVGLTGSSSEGACGLY